MARRFAGGSGCRSTAKRCEPEWQIVHTKCETEDEIAIEAAYAGEETFTFVNIDLSSTVSGEH